MEVDKKLKEALAKGDFRNEDEDSYVKMLEKDTKKNLYIKIGVGALYISLLLASLFIV